MTLPTSLIPITITCDYTDFVTNYRNAKLKKCFRSTTFLLKNLSFQFKTWESIFLKKNLSSNITLATLFSLLAMDNKPKDTIDNKYFNLLNHMTYYEITFYDLCVDAFLMHLSKQTKVYNNYTKPKKFFFFLNMEIKSFLFKKIRKILQIHKKDFYTNSSYFYTPTKYLDLHVDYRYLSYVEKKDPLLYSAYLFFLVNQSFNDYTLRNKFKLSISQSKKLKEDLCQLIKTLLLSS
jgi:hypothetical protein